MTANFIAAISKPNTEKSSRICYQHCLLIAGIQAKLVAHSMRTITRVDATLDFEFKCHLKVTKSNGFIMSVFIFFMNLNLFE